MISRGAVLFCFASFSSTLGDRLNFAIQQFNRNNDGGGSHMRRMNMQKNK